MDFHEIRFPPALSFGSLGGPQRRTDVVTLANGFEERNSPWAHSRRVYDAGVGMRSVDDLQAVIGFFEARYGQMYGFRWKDWADFTSAAPSKGIHFEDQHIAYGDGVRKTFQLIKSYRSGGHIYERPLTKPVAGTVRIGVEQVEYQEGVEYAVDITTGLITFADPPDLDMQIFAGYEFDVPVRFNTDRLQVSMASFKAGQVPDVPVLEVRV